MRVLFSLIFLLLCQAALSQYYRSSWSWKWELTRYDSNQIALIDNEANLITGFDFEDIEIFYSEYVAAKKAGKWGFITRKGRAVVPFVYEAVDGFFSNRACVKQNGKWGLIDTNGVFLLQPQFDFPLRYVPKMGFYSYKAGEKTGFVDTLGNILSPPQYYDVEEMFAENGLISGRTIEKRYPGMHGANMKSCCTVLIDRKGQNITGEKYNDIHIVDRKRGIYRTTHGTYLDSLGNLVPPTSTPNKWDWVNSYYTKSAFFTVKKAVRDSIIWSEKEADFVGSANGIQKDYCPPPPERVKIELEGLVNLKGEIILPIEYEEIEVLTANLFLVKKNKKYGIIDSTGGEILPFIYNKIYTHLTEYPILITKQDFSFYLFDASKTQPLTEKYASFKALDGSSWSKKERFLLVEKKGLNGLIDSLGREILPCQFVKIEELNRAFFKVHDGKAWGIWDTSGKSVQPCIYQKIEEWDDTKCKATIGGKLGILAINGTWIVKPEYDKIESWWEKYSKEQHEECYVAYKEDKFGLLNQKGSLITPIVYEFQWECTKERKPVKKNGKYGVLQPNGKLSIPTKYDDYSESASGKYITMIKKHRYHLKKQNFSYEGKKLDSLSIAQAEAKANPPTQIDTFVQTVKAKYPTCEFVERYYMRFRDICAIQQGEKLYGIRNEYTKKEILPAEYEWIEPEIKGMFIVRKNQKLGIVDSFNQIIAPFVYDTIMGFKNGGFRVCKAKKWGLIDTAGKEIVPCRFDETSYLQNGYVIVLENGRMGLWKRGKEIIPPTYKQYVERPDFSYDYEYDEPSDWNLMQYAPNFLVLLEKNKVFCVDSTGKRISRKYTQVTDFVPTANTQFICFEGKEKLLLVNQEGKEMLRIKDADELDSFYYKNEAVRQLIPISKKGKYALYRCEEGKIKKRTPHLYDGILISSSLPYIRVKENEKYGLLSFSGKVILPALYDQCYISSDDDYYWVQKGEKWGMVDSTLKTVIPIQYDNIKAQKNSFLVLENGKWGMLDKHYNRLLTSEYDSMSDIIAGCIVVEKNKMCAVINPKGQILLPYRAQGISIIDSTHYILNQGCEYQLADNQGFPIIQESYQYLNTESNQYLISAQKNKKWGLIDYRNGKEVLPFDYEEIEYYATGNFLVSKNEKWGMIDHEGKEILPFIYEHCRKEKDGFTLSLKEGEEGYYDINGKKIERETPEESRRKK